MKSFRRLFLALAWCCVALAWCCVALAVEIPVALVSDPPPAIDGSAERLAKLPTFRMIRGRSHVLYGPGNWTGDADLSAEMVVGYDIQKIARPPLFPSQSFTTKFVKPNLHLNPSILFLTIFVSDRNKISGSSSF